MDISNINVEERVLANIKTIGRSKKWLINQLGLSYNGLIYKLKNKTLSPVEIEFLKTNRLLDDLD